MTGPRAEPRSLAGRVALVTGGGRGIGRAVACTLAGAGARVAVLARTHAEVRAVAAEVDGLAVVADVALPPDVRRAVAETIEGLGPVDVLVNNAGVVWPLGPFVATDPDEWAAAIGVNLLGAARLTRAVLPGMIDRGYGRIVNISSGAADPPGMPSASAYSVAKAALDMLTASLAGELAGSGVTVNAVRPGTADTAMQDYMRSLPPDRVGAEFADRFATLHREGRLLPPELAARLVASLVASDRTGAVLDVRAEGAGAHPAPPPT